MRRLMGLVVLMSLVSLVPASQVQTQWALAWDHHPQASEIQFFILHIMQDSNALFDVQINGGNSTHVENVEIASGLNGIMTAALVACRSITDCSGPSNVVVFDRTAPNAPTSLWYNSR